MKTRLYLELFGESKTNILVSIVYNIMLYF